MSIEDDIKKAQSDGKLIIGSRKAIRALKSGSSKQAYYATNTSDNLRKELEGLSGDVKPFTGNSERLGIVCGKPFKTLVVAFSK